MSGIPRSRGDLSGRCVWAGASLSSALRTPGGACTGAASGEAAASAPGRRGHKRERSTAASSRVSGRCSGQLTSLRDISRSPTRMPLPLCFLTQRVTGARVSLGMGGPGGRGRAVVALQTGPRPLRLDPGAPTSPLEDGVPISTSMVRAALAFKAHWSLGVTQWPRDRPPVSHLASGQRA